MKKIMAVLLALILCLGLSALAEEENTAVEPIPAGPGMLAGGWQATEDATVTEETKELLSKALGTTPDFWLNLEKTYQLKTFDEANLPQVLALA